jgi:cold shock CspA family protein
MPTSICGSTTGDFVIVMVTEPRAARTSPLQVRLPAYPRAVKRDADLDIRRPDLLGVRRLGTVRWFKEEKGYGRITADDGEVLFVHFGAIIMGGVPLTAGGATLQSRLERWHSRSRPSQRRRRTTSGLTFVRIRAAIRHRDVPIGGVAWNPLRPAWLPRMLATRR